MAVKYVRCIAAYEDGSEHAFSVPEADLRRGDYIIAILAGENQRGGSLPPGKIKDAYRAPPGGRFP
jgi:hypothetical protein